MKLRRFDLTLLENSYAMIPNFQRSSYLQEDLDRLTQLCKIDSRTNQIENVQRVLLLTSQYLERMGFSIEWIENPDKPSQKLLHANRDGSNTAPQFTFISHADTVFENTELVLKDGWLWGSGVADNKGGIICALRTIHHLDEMNLMAKPNIKFICSCSEESGSLGFHHLFNLWGEQSDYVFGFEPAQQDGSFITERNGNRWYQVEIEGIAYHAGRFGEPSLNAAHEAAIKISHWIAPIDETKKMKLNVGSLSGGGDLFNVVCGKVQLKLDARFPTFEIRDELHEHIISVLKTSYLKCLVSGKPTLSSYEIKDDCPPMPRSKNSYWLKLLAQKIESLEDRQVTGIHSGGAADINYFANKNNTCLDGLGPVAIGMHTRDERLLVQSLETRPYALALFINDILKQVFLRGAIDEREFTKPMALED